VFLLIHAVCTLIIWVSCKLPLLHQTKIWVIRLHEDSLYSLVLQSTMQ
jgi:hypothetical protein